MKLVEYKSHQNTTKIMGGTPYIKWRDGMLCVAHRHTWDTGVKYRYYAHQFIHKIGDSVKHSDLFYIITKHMEFITSIHRLDDNILVLSLGVNDNKTAIVKVDISNIVFHTLE